MGPHLIFVGGFLGAGKTTLILRAAGLLRERGVRVGIIMNDQDRGLVDTKLAEAQAFAAGEVAGGCFCCRFSDLMDAADKLRAAAPEVIFAEPVGSCVDLSATILQPLKAYHADSYRLAPLTVLVDPEMCRRATDPNVRFLFDKQLAEADLICATKVDIYPDAELPVPIDFRLSGKTGEGVESWLTEVMDSRRVAGARLLDVDYTQYAEAEAALGWLNFHAEATLRRALSPAALVGPLLARLDERLTAAGIAIAHLKVFDQTGVAYVKASICAHGAEAMPEGDLIADAAARHEIVINLRALAEPAELESIVREALALVDGSILVRHVGAFRPSPPKPEHRFAQTV